MSSLDYAGSLRSPAVGHWVLPADYGFVILGGVAAGVCLGFTAARVGGKRKELGVHLPALYADEARAQQDPKAAEFNRWQRGAMNALETAPIVLFQSAVGGLYYPRAAGAALALFGVGAILYQIGYAKSADQRYAYGGFLVRVGGATSLVIAVAAGLKLLGYIQ